ncbi:hypothetical protein KXR53_01535 [Inquilinus limosus]|uniref:hypothetical protein n=1 Tax=Inquilinus limosus TaxID=171674 RepID=UPI003F15C023
MKDRVQNNWDIGLRLSDISPVTGILAKCGRCNRRRELDRRRLMQRFGSDARLFRIEMALRCTGCGSEVACRIELRAPRRD